MIFILAGPFSDLSLTKRCRLLPLKVRLLIDPKTQRKSRNKEDREKKDKTRGKEDRLEGRASMKTRLGNTPHSSTTQDKRKEDERRQQGEWKTDYMDNNRGRQGYLKTRHRAKDTRQKKKKRRAEKRTKLEEKKTNWRRRQ